MRLNLLMTCSTLLLLCVASQMFAQDQPTQKAKQVAHQTPLHLDYSPYPIDVRKPCHSCARPCDPKAQPCCDLPGLRGRPHIDQRLGGCSCGKKCADKHPMKSWNWPQPFSAFRECRHPAFAAWLDDPCRPKLTNAFDHLSEFRLIPYQRADNGYWGEGRDPYGCLGESRQMQSRVMGVQFRQPGEPVFGSPAASVYPQPTTSLYPQPEPAASAEVRVSRAGGYDLEAFRKR